MIKKTYLGRVSLLAILAAMLLVAPALAAVNFDSATGTGFVGKGDVQLAFGWNNKALQDNAQAVAFTYVMTNTYDVTEVWVTGQEKNPWSLSNHEVTVTTTTGINAAVDGDPRQVKGQNQFTGFNLTGYIGSPVTYGTVPMETVSLNYKPYTWINNKGVSETIYVPVDENENLYTEGNNKAVVKVKLISSTGGLYANFGGKSALLPQTPVV